MLTLDYKPVPDLSSAETQRLFDIAAPHYVDATALLMRDMEHCSHIYLCKAIGQIKAFFLIGWETLFTNGKHHPALFLGFSCCETTWRKSKITSLAYIQAGVDMANWVRQHQEPLIVWCTTATPVGLTLIPKFWNLLAPSLTGEYDERYVPIADAIREQYFSHGQPSHHPFVLKGVATGTRYSESERDYLSKVAQQVRMPTFEQLGIDERQGDRLLMLMGVPGPDKLDTLKAEQEQLLKQSM